MGCLGTPASTARSTLTLRQPLLAKCSRCDTFPRLGHPPDSPLLQLFAQLGLEQSDLTDYVPTIADPDLALVRWSVGDCLLRPVHAAIRSFPQRLSQAA